MSTLDPNLRKAAVLLRSLDSNTAALMLDQLSPGEAAAIRGAMRALGSVESDEQSDVAAELRRSRSTNNGTRGRDVELSLSASAERADDDQLSRLRDSAGRLRRFEFLESAPIHSLVPHLAREHAQTIAVVLSHLKPQRAAAVLAELPPKAQAATIERLSALGETDPESVSVLERELEAWFAKREISRAGNSRGRDTMATILAAADAASRERIMHNMKGRNSAATRANRRIETKRPQPIARPTTRAADTAAGRNSFGRPA
jgi:flagellar motor switch protein FliG